MKRPTIRRPSALLAVLGLALCLATVLGCHDSHSPSETNGDVISLLDLSPSSSTTLSRGGTVHVLAHLRCLLGAGTGGRVTANAFSPENGPVELTPALPAVTLTGAGGDVTLAFDLVVPPQQGGSVLLTFGLFRQGQTATNTTSTVLYHVP